MPAARRIWTGHAVKSQVSQLPYTGVWQIDTSDTHTHTHTVAWRLQVELRKQDWVFFYVVFSSWTVQNVDLLLTVHCLSASHRHSGGYTQIFTQWFDWTLYCVHIKSKDQHINRMDGKLFSRSTLPCRGYCYHWPVHLFGRTQTQQNRFTCCLRRVICPSSLAGDCCSIC